MQTASNFEYNTVTSSIKSLHKGKTLIEKQMTFDYEAPKMP